MLRATLCEYLGNEELTRQRIVLNPSNTPITIGRSETCTYQVGTKFGDLVKWLGRVQTTIDAEGEAIKLWDGTKEKPSTNGVFVYTGKIDGAIALTPGLQITLFKVDPARVTLEIAGSGTVGSNDEGHDTYTGEDLLERLQEKVEAFGDQIGALHTQVERMGGQLAQREAIDASQEQRLLVTEKRLNRVLAIVLGVVAMIVLASGWSGGTLEDRKQWSSTLQAVAIGIAAAYFKSKEKEQAKAAKNN